MNNFGYRVCQGVHTYIDCSNAEQSYCLKNGKQHEKTVGTMETKQQKKIETTVNESYQNIEGTKKVTTKMY